ncbi:hypothetical protein MTR67_037425 [Solanum verrucosum]|uniref:Uncharacterized protein n=1 Tax=Solanum verrucosum TaxID=315347 RepID=A0AAF0UDW5_SOLVR|nr:hypothetical protein MTR67_037425 [Solanum verrucosum]
MAGAAAHIMKRIPRIKFPQRHSKISSVSKQKRWEAGVGAGADRGSCLFNMESCLACNSMIYYLRLAYSVIDCLQIFHILYSEVSCSAGSTQQNSQHMKTSATDNVPQTFFSRSPSSMSVAGKASDQPKRTPVSQEEIESILVCINCSLTYTISLLVHSKKYDTFLNLGII